MKGYTVRLLKAMVMFAISALINKAVFGDDGSAELIAVIVAGFLALCIFIDETAAQVVRELRRDSSQ